VLQKSLAAFSCQEASPKIALAASDCFKSAAKWFGGVKLPHSLFKKML